MDVVEEGLKENKELVKEITAGVDAMDKDLDNVNKDMTDILEKMREPNKFCMDLLFMVICCFLLATFIYVGKMYLRIKSEN